MLVDAASAAPSARHNDPAKAKAPISILIPVPLLGVDAIGETRGMIDRDAGSVKGGRGAQ